MLEEANILANMIKRGYQEVREQFSRVRSNVDTMAAEVNGTASQVANLNEKIRFAVANGGSANELMDHRNLLTERLAALTGATVRQGSDGQVDVLIGGNALVTGSSAQQIAVDGTRIRTSPATTVCSSTWETEPRGMPVVLDGGEIAGALSDAGQRHGDGPLRQAAEDYNGFAEELAALVNEFTRCLREDWRCRRFFELDPADPTPSALRLMRCRHECRKLEGWRLPARARLMVPSPTKCPSWASAPSSPDRCWESIVTKIGVAAKTELQQANLADIAVAVGQVPADVQRVRGPRRRKREPAVLPARLPGCGSSHDGD